MAGPVVVGTPTTKQLGTAGTSTTINVPTGTAPGDLLLVLVSWRSAGATTTCTWTGTGTFTKVSETTHSTSMTTARFALEIPTGGTVPASISLGSSASSRMTAVAFRVNGHAPGDITDADGTWGTFDTTFDAPSVTTTQADALLIYFGTGPDITSPPITPDAAMTEIAEVTNTTAAGTWIEVATESRPTPGATGTRTATATGLGTVGNSGNGLLWAIKSASSGTAILAPATAATAAAVAPTITPVGGSGTSITAPPAAATASVIAPTITSAGGGTSVSDDFNRADATGLGAAWGSYTSKYGIVSNTARPSSSSSTCMSWYLTPTLTDNVDVQATLAAFTSGQVALMACFDGTGTDTASSGSFYSLRYDGTALVLLKHTALASSTTQLASTTTTVNVGDVVRLRVNSGVLTGYVNGASVVTTTDATPITGQRLHGLRSGASSTADGWDNWSATDLALTGSAQSIAAPAAGAVADMPVPIITLPGPTTLAADAASSGASMPTPVIDTVTTFTGSPAAATATMPAPTIATAGGPQTIAAIAAAASAVMPAPVIAATATIAAPVALATASVPSPVLVLDPPIGRRNVDFIRFDGSVMRLDRQETEYYDPKPVTVPTLGAWEASFDGGVTWIQPEVLNGRPLWLVTYGGDTSSGATVVPRTNVLPKLRDADNPETLVENGPRIIVV